MALRAQARTFRDPVHDIICWKDEGELGRLVCALIDAREMQRLRHVRQLGLASFVFHGAEHSRFAHSVGVAHVARRMVARLGVPLEDRLVVVAAALLHDVGHAPFSHVMERVFGFDHEAWTVDILRDPETHVHRVLAEVDGTLPTRVADLISGKGPAWQRAIVSSQLDADRCDYLLRDACMTGVEVGRYDLARILLKLGYDDDGLVVDIGAFESVEGYLIARYHMYRLVYFHRAVRCAEGMLQQVFARARWWLDQGDFTVAPQGVLGNLMRRQAVTPAAFSALGEYEAWSLLSSWTQHRDPVLSTLAGGLLSRQLVKANERRAQTAEEIAADQEVEARIRESLSPNERFYFSVDEAGDTPYRPYLPSAQGGVRSIRVRDRQGRVQTIEERSHLVRALAESTYRLRRWVYHPLLTERLRRIAGDAW